MLPEQIEFWHWLIAGVVFLALEVFAPGAILMWFGFGAVVVGILLWHLPGLTLAWQILIFAAVSAASVLAWRRSRFFREESTPSDDPTLNNRLNSHIGKQYRLTEALVNGRGRVEADGSTWQVRGEDMPAGTRVRVVGLEGMVFVVEKD